MSDEPYPDFNEVLKKVQSEQVQQNTKLLSELIVKQLQQNCAIPQSHASGWDAPIEVVHHTPHVIEIMPHHKANELFSKMLKGTPQPQAPIETIPDPEHDMVWTTADGRSLLVSQMETRHMFFALRKLYNELVPKKFQIDVVVPSRPISTDRLRALKILFYQIGKRDNLTDEQMEKLAYMAKITREQL